jgi:hypothetical protein
MGGGSGNEEDDNNNDDDEEKAVDFDNKNCRGRKRKRG